MRPGRARASGELLRALSRCALPALLSANVAACAGAEPLSFRVLSPESDDPFRGADALTIGLEREGVLDPASVLRLSPAADVWRLPGLRFGADLRLRVEAEAGPFALARGRSYPFTYAAEGPAPPPADVWLGTLGRFGTVADGAPLTALVPAPGGALGVDRDGGLWRFAAHDEQGHARLDRVGEVGLAGAVYIARENDIVGLGAQALVVIDQQGNMHHIEAPTGFVAGAAVTPLPDGVLVARPDGWLHRVRLDGGTATGEPLVALGPALTEPRAIAVPVRDAAAGSPRVVVLAREGAWVVDPDGVLAPIRIEASLPLGPTPLVLSTGLLALIGGHTDAGPTSEVLLLTIGGTLPQVLAPPPLFEARRDATAMLLAEGRALVVGGVGLSGPLASAELIEVRLDDLPGDVSITGSLPAPEATTAAASLADGTALVVGPSGCALYFDPSGG